MKLTSREKLALKDAVERPGGWGLFNPKTTAKLAERGFFIKENLNGYGMQWRITDAGRAALTEADV
ncbi:MULTISPECIES: hypothetical protein [unclassified Bradyrhizobium]|uniref:hypothetical protein n=1 Tax=unclassified Bradyrhizobium TaxID=2631580 RepID=UPI0028E5932F|nr:MULTISPECIES: hypothetical protein [unclassified Bradyrhizobium]